MAHLEQTQHPGAEQHHPEITVEVKGPKVIINLEDLFNGHCSHPEPDPGTKVYYLIKVDGKTFEVEKHEMTGREILKLVDKTPEKSRLYQLGHGQQEIEANEVVDFRKPGIERFQSVMRHANEGNGAAVEAAPAPVVTPLRRAFPLSPDDAALLDKMGYHWETLGEGQGGWVLIHAFPVPDGYTVTHTTVAFQIPPTYPTTELDMMYFYPEIHRADGRSIGALSGHPLDGKTFQRWSRHRKPGEWRPGVDNIFTHALAVTSWLQSELQK